MEKEQEQRRQYWIRNGRRFGFPECCIMDFTNRVDKNCDYENDYVGPKRIQIRVANSSGFLPCSYCSWKILSKQCELKDLIKNRIHRTPFPNDYIVSYK